MKNFKNKMGKFTITLLLVLSLIGLPMMTFAEEENPTPTPSESPTPTPTTSPTPTPTEEPTPSNSPTPTPTPTEKPVEKTIKLDKTNVEAVPGAAINIKATVTGVENPKIKWTSSNTSVATVNNGVVKALKSGNVTITATLEDDSSVSAQCNITITTKDNNTSSTSKEEQNKDKDKDKEKENLNLKSLKVKGYTLNEPFSSNRTGYTVDIPYEAEDVTIEVEKQSNNVKTEIKGATNLKVGRNTVTVTVKDNAGNSKVYTITVIRATKEERETKKNPTSHSVSQASSSLKPMSTRKNHTLEYAFVTIGCFILFAIGGLGIYFYIITSGKDKKKKKEKKQKVTKKEIEEKPVVEEEKIETPMVEVSPDQDDELGKTIEFTEEAKKLEDKKSTPSDLKKESAILKEVEDLFDDE